MTACICSRILPSAIAEASDGPCGRGGGRRRRFFGGFLGGFFGGFFVGCRRRGFLAFFFGAGRVGFFGLTGAGLFLWTGREGRFFFEDAGVGREGFGRLANRPCSSR